MSIMVDQLQTVRRQGGLTFTLTQNRIIVKTSLQTFFLEPIDWHWKKKYDMLRLMIDLDKVNSLDDLASWCRNDKGKLVIEWRTSIIRYGELDEN